MLTVAVVSSLLLSCVPGEEVESTLGASSPLTPPTEATSGSKSASTLSAYREDPHLVSFLAEAEDISVSEARSLARWDALAGQVAEAIYIQFGDIVVSTEVDHERRALVIHVTTEAEDVREYAYGYLPDVGTIEVFGGYLPPREVEDWWYRIEQAITEANVSHVGGAVGPNEITIYTSEPLAVRAIVGELELPDQIAVELEPVLSDLPPEPAVWEVLPDVDIAESALSIPILVTELACSGGATPIGRILPPQVEYRPSQIVVSIDIVPKEGFQDCVGNAPTPMLILLSEPLGSRTLVDGGDLSR